jgi:hypothetical protein
MTSLKDTHNSGIVAEGGSVGSFVDALRVATAVLGGTTQLVIKLLTETTGNSLAPAWYMTGALAVGAVAVVFVRETAFVKTGRLTF